MAVSKRRVWWVIGAITVLLVVLMIARSLAGKAVPVVEAQKSTLAQKVVMSGRVRAPARIHPGSLLPGIVRLVAVDEGQKVKAGDLLVQFDDAEHQAAAAQARAGVELAKARFGRVRQVGAKVAGEQLRQAQVSVEQAQRAYERVSSLAKAGSASQSDLDDAQSALALARSRLTSAQAQVESSAPSGSEAREAMAGLAQAEASLAAAEARLAQTKIIAPSDAIVLQRNVEPGDVVTAGKQLFTLARIGATQLTAEPDEKTLAYLEAGQPGVASADAFAGQRFNVKVALISPSVDPERGTVEVRLDVAEPPPYLKPDMTVSIEVEVARRGEAVVVASEAIRDPLSARPWVLAVQDGKTQRREVGLGLQGEGRIEVVSGLSAGDLVVPASVAGVKEGQRVRPERGG